MSPGNQPRGLEKSAFDLALESPHRQRATAARKPPLRCDETVHLPVDAHGCCCPVGCRLLPLPQVAEARMEMPWSPSCPVFFFPTALTSGVKAKMRATTCLFFFSFLGTRRAHKCLSAPLYQDLRQSRNGPVPPPVSLCECNWLM